MTKEKLNIGVLALQGCVDRHRPHIIAAGASFCAVKTPEKFQEIDALIIPGGESTTMLKLIDTFGLEEDLKKVFAEKPVWGICAGSILMADKVINPIQKSFHMMPVTMERNGYGRQLESHNAVVDGFEVSFIRAPVVKAVNDNVEILASHDGAPVWLRSGRYMVTTFHPELTLEYPSPMHQAFVHLTQEFS
ncbi:MAG: pyridoxal 5'-phosphate synthase subunit PdxT [Micavibrio sp.]|nr:MAG: pyridoxal 5'-phosphate synthase subunit PdxT [Micavibrio sp.]